MSPRLAVSLIALSVLIGCSSSSTTPSADTQAQEVGLAADGEACRLFYDYEERRQTNLDGDFDEVVELTDTVEELREVAPENMTFDLSLVLPYVQQLEALRSDPGARADLTDSEAGQKAQAALERIVLRLEINCDSGPSSVSGD